jgi:hypothetical protein
MTMSDRQFIQARWYTPNGMDGHRAVVLHCAQARLSPSFAVNLGNYFARHPGFAIINGKRVVQKPSAHAGAGVTTVDYVKDLDEANHAAGCNGFALGLEQAGFAEFGRDDWMAADYQRMIKEQSAPWVAEKILKYGIPLQLVTEEMVRDDPHGWTGVITHGQWNKWTDNRWSSHWDTGDNYPLELLMESAQNIIKPPVQLPEEDMKLIAKQTGTNSDGSPQLEVSIVGPAGCRHLGYAEWSQVWASKVDVVLPANVYDDVVAGR